MLRQLYGPAHGGSVVFFRIAFGLLMLWGAVRYLVTGRVTRYYVEPEFHFHYLGFEWVEPLPAAGMHAVFVVMALASIGIAVGFLYRLSALAFLLTFSYAFLLEKARYLNHYYLIGLFALLLVFVPAHRAFSLDARRRPQLASPTVPAWSLWLLRGQLAIVYFYAGVAKLNADWLDGQPMRMWLQDRADAPIVGALLAQDWVGYAFSYGALGFDLMIAPLLLWPRTRAAAFALAVTFHAMNAVMFQIGVFPWLAIAATTIFFRPDWPARLFGMSRDVVVRVAAPSRLVRSFGTGLIALYASVQVLLPLRHFLYPGNVSWTEEGHMFAWHMKLRDKAAEATLVAFDPIDERMWQLDSTAELLDWQARKMRGRPDMILEYAHHVGRRLREQTGRPIQIRARVHVSLNGRPSQLLIDPNIDLMTERRSLWPADWIVPLADPGAPRRAGR